MDHMREWTLRALMPLWTGGVNGQPTHLHPTGIMGSLRWWYEVLVRGLGGKACDPTSDVRCPDQNGHHCVVCELFGCTGWARKFRLMVLDESGRIIQNQIQADQTFILRFIPLRPIREEEWCLLDATLGLIADYGAMGGKTVFKPSDERGRENAFHHRDFGLVQYVQSPHGWQCDKNLEDIRAYVTHNRWRTNFDDSAFSWASLQHFWCVKGRYLARQRQDESSFNAVLGRKQDKSIKKTQGRRVIRWSDLLENRNDAISEWLAGSQQESKKVFSFKHPKDARRTFGFVKPGLVDFDEMKRRLEQVWSDFQAESEFQTGEQILNELFEWEEGA